MRAELVTELTVTRYAAFAEMAWLVRRPELGVVCYLARESGGTITPEIVAQALPGLGDVAARNVVRWCRSLDLCDKAGGLTRLGEEVAETEEAPVLERGVYDLWLTQHALLGSRILHAERLSSTRDGRYEDIEEPALLPDQGRDFTSVVDPGTRFLLRSFPANHRAPGALAIPTRARCTMTWTLDTQHGVNDVRLGGFLDVRSSERPVSAPPERVEIDLWGQMRQWAYGPLLEHGEWHSDTHQLAVAFDGLPEVEQESFERDVQIGAVDIPDYGHWDDVRLAGVPIGPATSKDADSWAMTRLDRRLRTGEVHRTRSDVRELFTELTEDTPLELFQPTLPGHSMLLDRYADSPDVFWRLAAPADLAPVPLSPQELAPMRVGAPVADQAPSITGAADVVRLLSYGWSMRTLLDRLTGGREVDRLLLVDRYVVGRNNLASLALFVTALAEQGSATVDVWTGNEVDDATIEEIRGITGRQPRRYRDVFGRTRHHDRYLVVVPDQGPAFGWQMSNSPLHARPHAGEPVPATPLRWHDLIAMRLSVEQLPEPMVSWASRGVA